MYTEVHMVCTEKYTCVSNYFTGRVYKNCIHIQLYTLVHCKVDVNKCTAYIYIQTW